MSLQTKAEKLATQIAEDSAAVAKYINNAITHTNNMSNALTHADNETLAEFLNTRGARLQSDLEEHEQVGLALNAAADSASRRLGVVMPRVFMSSMADKLLSTNRTATLTEAGWVVEDIPQPEPEPEPEP